VKLINPAATNLFQPSLDISKKMTLAEFVRNYQVVDTWQKCVREKTQQSTTFELNMEKPYIQVIAVQMGTGLPGNTLLIFQDLSRVKRLESVRQDFVSNVSHELRTPLSSLKALLETLKDGAIHDPRAAEHFLNQMDQETDNLIQMVEELLELSRIESGKVPLNICSVQPFELLKTALDRMKVQAQRADLRIKIKINSNSIIPSVQADPQRIELVLINLIHNAIKFTEPGGKYYWMPNRRKLCDLLSKRYRQRDHTR